MKPAIRTITALVLVCLLLAGMMPGAALAAEPVRNDPPAGRAGRYASDQNADGSLSIGGAVYIHSDCGSDCAACEIQALGAGDATAFGIDVSLWQGEIDWETVAEQIDFAIIRCGFGENLTDQDDAQWFNNVEACTRLGIPFGVYLYSYATTDAKALSEAQHVLRLLEGYEPTLPVYLDLEDDLILRNCTNEDILRHTRIFCTAIEEAGYRAGVYSNPWWWNTFLVSDEYDQWDRWLAQYASAPTLEKDFSVWQYTDSGRIDGIYGNVDLNYWFGEFPPHRHSYTGEITVEPGCEVEGVCAFTCECGDSYTEPIPAAGHDYMPQVTEPTCMGAGFTTWQCGRCGNTFQDSFVDPLGHSFASGCCTVCGETDPDYVPPFLAEGTSGDLSWRLDYDGILTFSGTGAMENYTSRTAMPWYDHRAAITTVILEDGAAAIGDYAFCGMPALKTVSIPGSVTAIGGYAFKDCPVLEDVTLPGGLTRLGDSAFYGCASLTSVDIPASLYTVRPYTFKNCTSLASVTFHEGNLQKISDGAFYGTALTEVSLPDCLDILDVYSFKNCAALERVSLGSGLTEIREAAFYGTALRELEIPDGIIAIGPYAFKNCAALTGLTLPAALTTLGEAAFYGCVSLETLALPDAVTSVGSYAFRKCAALEAVTFGAGLEAIGESAFYGCARLEEVILPEGLAAIGSYAFKGCGGITTVLLPGSLQTLGDSAFHSCTGLRELEIPAGVTAIGEYCFSGSWNLWQITFRGSAPAIGTGAFRGLAAVARYPGGDASWTSDLMGSYGGSIIWKAY